MAGAGYKLFTTGQVLTAAEVNTYLQEQVIMVFNDATARTTALSGVLAEGMVSYLKSTKVVEIYNGTAWASLDDPNAIQNTIVDAKGDLITATAADTPARLAVGNNGETLVADSSTSTGLRWQPVQSATNYLINSLFDFWQRGTSSGSAGYVSADRWYQVFNAGSGTAAQSTASPLPSGGRYFMRCTATAASTNYIIYQALETAVAVPLRSKVVTLSAYLRGSFTGSFLLDVTYSNSTDALTSQATSVASSTFTATSTWTRYSITFTVPSDAVGLRIGVGTNGTPMNNTQTFDIFGVQLEEGSVATPLVRAGGTLAGELAACQRYYIRMTNDGASDGLGPVGSAFNTGGITAQFNPPVKMRVTPTSVDWDNIRLYDGVTVHTVTAVTLGGCASGAVPQADFSATTLTQYRYYRVIANSGSSFIGFNAEL